MRIRVHFRPLGPSLPTPAPSSTSTPLSNKKRSSKFFQKQQKQQQQQPLIVSNESVQQPIIVNSVQDRYFVYPIQSPATTTIGALAAQLSYFCGAGVLGMKLDGFDLSTGFLCSDVLKEDELITVDGVYGANFPEQQLLQQSHQQNKRSLDAFDSENGDLKRQKVGSEPTPTISITASSEEQEESESESDSSSSSTSESSSESSESATEEEEEEESSSSSEEESDNEAPREIPFSSQTEQPVTTTITAAIPVVNVPLSLGKHKRRQTIELLKKPVMHIRFDHEQGNGQVQQDQETAPPSEDINETAATTNRGKAVITEVYLEDGFYNNRNVKRNSQQNNKTKKNNNNNNQSRTSQPQQQSQEQLPTKPDIEFTTLPNYPPPVFQSSSSTSTTSPTKTKPQHATLSKIAFKRLFLSKDYEPVISDYQMGEIQYFYSDGRVEVLLDEWCCEELMRRRKVKKQKQISMRNKPEDFVEEYSADMYDDEYEKTGAKNVAEEENDEEMVELGKFDIGLEDDVNEEELRQVVLQWDELIEPKMVLL